VRFTIPSRKGPRMLAAWTLIALAGSGVLATQASAKGGTAKPPQGAVSPIVTPTLADPAWSVDPSQLRGFDVTGYIQASTVGNDACPNETDTHRYGGTVTLNGTTITVPCNLVVQMPANTLTWSDFVGKNTLAPLDLTTGVGNIFPSVGFELHAIGNTVGSKDIAGLVYVSQQSTNGGSGVIKTIDYANGDLTLDNGTLLEINDPNGRFGRVQSLDSRFSVDDANPTIHAATGYPMCVPRTDPSQADDPLCPQKNRPKAADAGGCRNFSVAGVVPPASGELSRPAPGQVYCSQYVMPAGGAATGPDPRQQAPFEVGDFINYSGTLMIKPDGTKFMSANTIEANLGIYTQPGTQPAYTAIGEFGVGSADPSATAVNGVAQETADRIFLEAETTDVKTPVDIYMMDVNKDTGAITNRWITPYEMTGENQLGVPSGGITTQNTGAQPQRARIRATKAPTGLLSQPSRTVRVVQRTLCQPQPVPAGATGPYDQAALDKCLNDAPTFANGLKAGQYLAPVFDYIFPENVKPGDLVVPNDLWHLPFLRSGEGATTASQVGPSVGALTPTPW
jgi:hypothetical protein